MSSLTKHRAVSIAAWILFAMIAVLWLLTAGYGLIISVKAYQPALCIWGSPFIGFSKFSEFWRSGDGSNAFANSFTLSLWGFLGSLLIGGLAAWFIPRIREKKRRFMALAAMLVPAFIPSVCWAAGILPGIGQDPQSAAWRYILVEIITHASFVGFAGAVFGMILPARGFFNGIAWSAVLWVFLCLTPNFELTHVLRSPVVSMDTMDAYAYRIGILQENYNSGAMIQQLKSLLQILLGGVVCAGVYFVFFFKRKPPIDSVLRELPQISFSAWALPATLITLIFFILFVPTLYLQSYASELWRQLPMQIVSTALTFLFTLVFSWGLIHALRSMSLFIFAVCAGLLLSLTNPMVGSLVFFTDTGLMSTIFPGVLTALLNPPCLMLILLSARLSQMGHLHAQPVWWIALLPASLASARHWGDALSPSLYLGNQRFIPFGSLLHMQQTDGSGSNALTYFCVLVPALLSAAAATYGIFRYVDMDKAPVKSLFPENDPFAKNIVYHRHKNHGDAVSKTAVPPPASDSDVVEQQREPE